MGPSVGRFLAGGQPAGIYHYGQRLWDDGRRGPPVVIQATSEKVSKEELGGVGAHCNISGVADNPAGSDEEAIQMVKRYLSYLPSNAWQYPPHHSSTDDPNRVDEELLTILPENPKRPYDMKRIIESVVDKGSFFEIKPDSRQ